MKQPKLSLDETLMANLILEVDKDGNYKVLKDRFGALDRVHEKNIYRVNNVVIIREG